MLTPHSDEKRQQRMSSKIDSEIKIVLANETTKFSPSGDENK